MYNRQSRGRCGIEGVIRRGIVALSATAWIEANRDASGIAKRAGMFAARPMAVFALDIGEIGERGIIGLHARPIAIGQHGRKGPAELGSHVVKAVIDGQGIGVVTHRMARDAVIVVSRCVTIDVRAEHGCMKRFIQIKYLIIRHNATAMAKRASVHTHVDTGGEVLGDIRRAVRSGGNGGRDGVLAAHIGPQHSASGDLIG